MKISLNNMSAEERKNLNPEIKALLNKKPEDITDEEVIEYYKGPISDRIRESQRKITTVFAEVSPYSTLVQSVGNAHPIPNRDPPLGYQWAVNVEPVQVRNSQVASAILVGSLAPNGDKSDFSQKHSEVAIMAPSDYSIHTRDKDEKNLVKFDGTSGAAPLVTGSLLAFSDMSGYYPTAKEAKTLLQKTAIPHRYSNDQPRTNGVGMVNAYKMGILGRELKKICKSDPACFRRMIQSDSTYDSLFPVDASLHSDLQRVFPECSRSVCADVDSYNSFCEEKQSVFKRLRKQAFLNPKKAEYARYLSCIYAGRRGKIFRDTSLAKAHTYMSNSEHGAYLNDNEQFCKTNLDCVLVPVCGHHSQGKFISISKVMSEVYYNVDYYEKCGPPKCYDKCRCDNLESRKSREKVDPKTGKKQVYWKQYSAKCIGMRCELRTEEFKKVVDSGVSSKAGVDFSKESGKSVGAGTGSGAIQ